MDRETVLTMLAWIHAIENEDGENFSFGSVRTLGMIKKALHDETELTRSEPAVVDQIQDYDCGIINDYGGGNIEWWQDYIRAEIGRCNDYWREQLKQHNKWE